MSKRKQNSKKQSHIQNSSPQGLVAIKTSWRNIIKGNPRKSIERHEKHEMYWLSPGQTIEELRQETLDGLRYQGFTDCNVEIIDLDD